MKKIKRVYNWHYWVKIDPDTQFQVVIPETCYGKAVCKMKEVFQNNALHSTSYNFKFQFGQKEL